jgi:hypothetical protein
MRVLGIAVVVFKMVLGMKVLEYVLKKKRKEL